MAPTAAAGSFARFWRSRRSTPRTQSRTQASPPSSKPESSRVTSRSSASTVNSFAPPPRRMFRSSFECPATLAKRMRLSSRYGKGFLSAELVADLREGSPAASVTGYPTPIIRRLEQRDGGEAEPKRSIPRRWPAWRIPSIPGKRHGFAENGRDLLAKWQTQVRSHPRRTGMMLFERGKRNRSHSDKGAAGVRRFGAGDNPMRSSLLRFAATHPAEAAISRKPRRARRGRQARDARGRRKNLAQFQMTGSSNESWPAVFSTGMGPDARCRLLWRSGQSRSVPAGAKALRRLKRADTN